MARERRRLKVRGIVQAVGFRPHVHRLATRLGLTGWVRNDGDHVSIEVAGAPARLDAFRRDLELEAPPGARLEAVEVVEAERLPAEVPGGSDGEGEPGCLDGCEGAGGFRILESAGEGGAAAPIPADLATCPDCLREVLDPADRRHAYPFTNCTNCGPRWSIIRGVPYDRALTTMAGFPLCEDCEREYRDPADRRFHAQPVACPACGPRLQLVSPDGEEQATRGEALARAATLLREGGVLALLGIGGFQLLTLARDEAAVTRLRQRKQRPTKPLAVMVRNLDEARELCEVSEVEAAELASAAAPILLLRRREPCALATSVAPGNTWLGVMLPYTPLHRLLLDAVGEAVVCTSGNLSEEPMCVTLPEAVDRLRGVPDALLVHDRPIARPVDDSVVRVDPDGPLLLRRARGHAPRPVPLGAELSRVLALGAELKGTVALGLGDRALLSQHLGDLESRASEELLRATVEDMLDFFGVEPEAIACDLHPDLRSTRLAEELAVARDLPLHRVQHHHAHVAACMAEYGLEGEVAGLAFDGTGWGEDETVWGGEVLVVSEAGYRRVAHLRPFRLPGGDVAAREPRRSALGLVFEARGEGIAEQAGAWFEARELRPMIQMLERGVRSPWCSSMGRLFDGLAAVVGIRLRQGHEAQAACELEQAAGPDPEQVARAGDYPLPILDGEPAVIDWAPMLEAVLQDLGRGVERAAISGRIHGALAGVCVELAGRVGLERVALTGGCFQNRLLRHMVRTRLAARGHRSYTPRLVPVNDGGISLGQVWVAGRRPGIG